MNERIKELAKQVAKEEGWGVEVWQTTFTEKFAELIIQECAKIVEGSSLPDAYSEPCLELIADDIRGHFGVK